MGVPPIVSPDIRKTHGISQFRALALPIPALKIPSTAKFLASQYRGDPSISLKPTVFYGFLPPVSMERPLPCTCIEDQLFF